MVGAELGFPELERLLEERQGQVQLPGSLIATARLFMLRERVGMVGAELGFLELERLLEERQGQVQLPGSLIRQARLFMLASVSGWSGPSLAFVSLSVSSKSGRARSSFPAS